MVNIEERTGQFLRSLPFFSNLPEMDLMAFMKSAQVRDYKKQQHLFARGDKADRFFIIISGWIKLHRETPEGEEAIVALFTRSDVFGEAAIFGGADYPFSAEVVEDTRVAEIPSSILKERAGANPAIMERIMASMSREMHQLQMETEHLALMSAPQRVGCLLLQLSSGMVGDGGTMTFPYDKSLAAARLGMKPETFSRALAQLKPAGVTVRGSEVEIDSFGRLAEFTCSHCSMAGECSSACHAACAENARQKKRARPAD
jgi:CRP-like cAMP-binding protein